jgi:hypothetical protein
VTAETASAGCVSTASAMAPAAGRVGRRRRIHRARRRSSGRDAFARRHIDRHPLDHLGVGSRGRDRPAPGAGRQCRYARSRSTSHSPSCGRRATRSATRSTPASTGNLPAAGRSAGLLTPAAPPVAW